MYQSRRVAKVLLYNLYTICQLIKVHNSKKRLRKVDLEIERAKKVKGESPSYRLIFLRSYFLPQKNRRKS